MFENIQAFRRKLAAGQLCLGAGVTFADPAVSEALAETADFLWLDLEHSPTDLQTLLAHLIAARAGGAAALVRVPAADVAWIKRVLDVGAEGIIVPQIRSADEVRAVVAACRYAPQGNRGFGPRRAARYGRIGGDDYLRLCNEAVFVVAQIETVEAVADLDAILAVPGLDSLVIGPYDLSGSLGMLGQVRHPTVVQTIRTVIDKARAAGRHVGMGMAPDPDHARQAIELGAQWLQVGGDYGYMVRFADELFARIRGPR